MIDKYAQPANQIPVAEHAHILYVYDREEEYIKNVISFTEAAIEQENYILLIEEEHIYTLLKEKLSHNYSAAQLKFILFTEVQTLVKAIEQCDNAWNLIADRFLKVLDRSQKKYSLLRLWVHTELPAQGSEPIIRFCKKFSENYVRYLDIMYVNVFNGHQISASLENTLKKYHEYFMTDWNYVMSNLFDEKKSSALALARQQTKRKAERQLAATQMQLKLFINQNLDPIVVLDRRDYVVSVNLAYTRLLGWEEKEIRGLMVAELPDIPQDHLFEMGHDRGFVRLKKKVPSYDSVRRTKSGTLIYVSVTGYPLFDENGDVDGRVIMFRDITAIKQAQSMLLKTEKLSVAGELAAGIVHEIRNPITAIKGFLQLIKHEKKNNSPYIDIMGSEIERIETILNELLLLAKPQVSHFQKQNLITIVNETITLLKGQASLDKINMKLVCDTESILLFCDKNQLKQVFINLTKNAIEAMPEGGTISIHVKCFPDEVLIRFIDQGVGISEKVMERVGEPFFTTKEKGTGLGFMVSREIIKNHQGIICFSSQVGKGTIVEVHLPCTLRAESKGGV